MKNYKLQITGDPYRVTSFLENLIETKTSPLNEIDGFSLGSTLWDFVRDGSKADLEISSADEISNDVILLIKEQYGVEAELELVAND
jgi:hypothetical protein